MSLTGLAVAAIAVAIALAFGAPTRSRPSLCGQCAQDVAEATYYVFTQLDCDGQLDSPLEPNGTSCTDELDNVNRLPKVDNLEIRSGGTVVVTLTTSYAGGPGGETDVITFRGDGVMLGDRTLPAS